MGLDTLWEMKDMMIMSYVISADIEGIYLYSHWKGTSILQIIIDWHCCSSITFSMGSMYILRGA